MRAPSLNSCKRLPLVLEFGARKRLVERRVRLPWEVAITPDELDNLIEERFHFWRTRNPRYLPALCVGMFFDREIAEHA